MPIKIEIINAGPEPMRSASITGASDRQSSDQLRDFVNQCFQDGVRQVVLDLSGLVSIDHQMIPVLKNFHLKLLDRAGCVHLVNPDAIISWMLEDDFGDVQLIVHSSLENAVESILNQSSDIAVAVEAGGIKTVDQWMDLLVKTGLCNGGAIYLEKDGMLFDINNHDVAINSSTTLAQELQSIRTVMKSPIERQVLSVNENAFIRKCDADLVVPLQINNKVIGWLMLQSGRAGSLSEYRSGELLSFDLVGMKIADLLFVDSSFETENRLYLVPQL
jgi:anti-anti-sigma regulatory factor